MPSLDFACYLANLTGSELTGVFLENLVEDEKPVVRSLQGVRYVDWQVDTSSGQYMQKREAIDKNIIAFRTACLNRSVRVRVHRDRGVPAREIIHETRYADLLVTDAETSFNKKYEGAATGFVRDILQDAECPVVIAPESFNSVDELVFTFDGSKSSMFAIRQFTYLLPELADKRLTLVQAGEGSPGYAGDKHALKEWIQNHYGHFSMETLDGDADSRLFDYLFRKENVMVVMGAYGRNAVSRFFRQSHADILIRTITQPIFISHY
jgi:nucleotide-binding universal stress UspA family protein